MCALWLLAIKGPKCVSVLLLFSWFSLINFLWKWSSWSYSRNLLMQQQLEVMLQFLLFVANKPLLALEVQSDFQCHPPSDWKEYETFTRIFVLYNIIKDRSKCKVLRSKFSWSSLDLMNVANNVLWNGKS